MIRRALLVLVAGSVLVGLVRNVAADPAAGLLGAVVLALVGYLGWRAWSSVRADAGRARRRLFGGRHRHAGPGTF